jgi:hypothetical protein
MIYPLVAIVVFYSSVLSLHIIIVLISMVIHIAVDRIDSKNIIRLVIKIATSISFRNENMSSVS